MIVHHEKGLETWSCWFVFLMTLKHVLFSDGLICFLKEDVHLWGFAICNLQLQILCSDFYEQLTLITMFGTDSKHTDSPLAFLTSDLW